MHNVLNYAHFSGDLHILQKRIDVLLNSLFIKPKESDMMGTVKLHTSNTEIPDMCIT